MKEMKIQETQGWEGQIKVAESLPHEQTQEATLKMFQGDNIEESTTSTKYGHGEFTRCSASCVPNSYD